MGVLELGVKGSRVSSSQAAPHPGLRAHLWPELPAPTRPGPSALPFALASSGTWTCPRPAGHLERVTSTCCCLSFASP